MAVGGSPSSSLCSSLDDNRSDSQSHHMSFNCCVYVVGPVDPKRDGLKLRDSHRCRAKTGSFRASLVNDDDHQDRHPTAIQSHGRD